MNEVVKNVASTPLTRKELRAALIGKRHAVESDTMTLFGVEIELRQPTLKAILNAREEDDVEKRTTDVFIRYAYVPGTDERIFEDTDRAAILEWPFNNDLIVIQEKIAKLTGVDLGADEAEEELKSDPLEGSS
jgi:hypothetical protein